MEYFVHRIWFHLVIECTVAKQPKLCSKSTYLFFNETHITLSIHVCISGHYTQINAESTFPDRARSTLGRAKAFPTRPKEMTTKSPIVVLLRTPVKPLQSYDRWMRRRLLWISHTPAHTHSLHPKSKSLTKGVICPLLSIASTVMVLVRNPEPRKHEPRESDHKLVCTIVWLILTRRIVFLKEAFTKNVNSKS